MTMRRLLSLLLPEGAILLAATALLFWGGDAVPTGMLERTAPPVVLAAGALLCWRFGRGRLLLALGAVALADRAIAWLPPGEADAAVAGHVVAMSIAMLLPATMVALSLSREHPLTTWPGQRRLALLGAQALGVLLLALAAGAWPAHVGGAYQATIFPAWLFAWSPLGQPATLLALLAVTVLAARVLWRGDAESRGFLWAGVGGAIAAGVALAGGEPTLHFTAAGAVLLASTIESAHALAFRDELTTLPARRALTTALAAAGDTYTVAMVDVDHFKQFNDTHGHDVGDQLLRMVASRLGAVRGGGRAYRYGGEEFTVLFAGKRASECEAELEALRESVERATFRLRGGDRPKKKPVAGKGRKKGAGELSVTVSIGAAESRRGAGPDAVLRAADQALYRAKEAGRNRVEIGR